MNKFFRSFYYLSLFFQEATDIGMKRLSLDDSDQMRKKGPATIATGKNDPDALKPLDKNHADVLINFLMRLACSVCFSVSKNYKLVIIITY